MAGPSGTIAPMSTTPEPAFDTGLIASLLRENGETSTVIKTVDRPEGFRVGFDKSGAVVEIKD